jgi:ADP-ribose pyrophosphatase YjhB (NUDIX family)
MDEIARGRLAALRLRLEIEKGFGPFDPNKHPRYPKDDPHGGQFAPKGQGRLGAWFQNFFHGNAVQATDMPDPHWQPPEPAHTFERKGSILHPFPDDKGRPAYIFKPSMATVPAEKAWRDANGVVTVTPGSPVPAKLNGIAMEPAPAAENWQTVAGQNPQIEVGLPDLETVKGKHPAAGVIIEEPDGRIWLCKPLNHFGGYRQTFPKGTQEHGLNLQQTAIKEAWEETGMKIELVGVLGDFERTTSVARYYIAKRVGGSPSAMGWESQALRLVPPSKLPDFLNMHVDRDILSAYLEEKNITKGRAPFVDRSALAALQARLDALSLRTGITKSFDETKHPRWPKGSPLAGQFMQTDAQGITTPPVIGSAGNPGWQKKADAAYALAKAGDTAKIGELADALKEKVSKYGYEEGAAPGVAYGKKPHSQAGWAQQTHQYVQHLYDQSKGATFAKLTADPGVEAGTSPVSLAQYKKVGGKLGGTSKAAQYEAPDGTKYYVKGVSGQGNVSADRAKNEVLASKLLQASGAGVVEMHLVSDLPADLGGKPGAIGVASKMVNGPMLTAYSGPAATKNAQMDYAAHAWLANYDVIGQQYDNTIITPGNKPVNIDPGGSLLYRAQGVVKYTDLPFGQMDEKAPEWFSMRDKGKNAQTSSIYGSMTSADLANSAEKLKLVDDKTITDLVNKYGPGTDEQKKLLASSLIKRRDAILSYAGVDGSMVQKGPEALATPAPDFNSKAFGTPGDNIDANGKMQLANAKAAIMSHLSNNGLGDGPGQLNAFGAAGLHKAITEAKTASDISDAVNSLKDWQPTSPYLQEAKKHLLKSTEHVSVSMGMGASVAPPHVAAVDAIAMPSTTDAAATYIDQLHQAALEGDLKGMNDVLYDAQSDFMGPTKLDQDKIEGYHADLKTAVKYPSIVAPPGAITATEWAAATDPKAGKPTKASLKKLAAASDKAINQLTPTQSWADDGLKAHMAIEHAIANHDPDSVAKAWEVINSPQWQMASMSSPVGGAKAALEAYATEADAYLTAHPKKGAAAASKWSLTNPPTAFDFATKADLHMGDIDAITAAYKEYALGNGVGDLVAKAQYWNDYVKAHPGAEPTDAGWQAIKVKADYANSLLPPGAAKPKFTGKKAGGQYGTDADHDGKIHEADHKTFGPGNAPKASDFLEKPFGGKKDDAVPATDLGGHQLHLEKIEQAHMAGDKAMLAELAADYQKQVDTGINGSGTKLTPAGIHNQGVKAAYAKGMLDDLRKKAPALPFASGDKPSYQAFKDAGITAPTAWTNKIDELADAGVGSEVWTNQQQKWATGDINSTDPWKKAAGIGKAWMQQQEDFAAAEVDSFAADPSKPVTSGATWKAPTTDDFKAIVEAANGDKVWPTKGAVPVDVWTQFAQNSYEKGEKLDQKLWGTVGDATTEIAGKINDLIDAKNAALGGSIAPDAPEMAKPNATTVKPEWGPNNMPGAGDFGVAGVSQPAEWYNAAQTYMTWYGQAKAGDAAYLEQLKNVAGTAYNAKYGGGDAIMMPYVNNLIADLESGGTVAVAPTISVPKPAFQPTTPTAVEYYNGIADKMEKAYLAGDLPGVLAAGQKLKKGEAKPIWPVFEAGSKKGLPKTANGKLLSEYQANLMTQLADHEKGVIAAKLEKPVGAVPSEGMHKGDLPAMPRFDAQMIGENNTNAASHNAKVYQIKMLAQKGDVKGLLALNYGTNTYGKKQVKLANDTLAALGSDFKVTAGQKKNTHWALTSTGNEQPVMNVQGKPLTAALTDKEIPSVPDFLTNKNGMLPKPVGQPLSSKAGLNTANQNAVDKLVAAAKAGDVKAVKSATYEVMNPDGTPTGKTALISEMVAGKTGSQHILNLQATLLQAMDEKLHPPEPLKFFAGKAFNSVHEVSQAVPPAPFGNTTKQHPTSQAVGYFLALGQVKNPDNLQPTKLFDTPASILSKAKGDYNNMSKDAQKFVRAMTGTGGVQFANPLSPGGSHYGIEGAAGWKSVAQAAHEYARELPEGTVIYKWDDLSTDTKQKLALAEPGLIIQNPAPVCASYSPTATKGFGPTHRFKIIMAKGAKVVSTFSHSGGHPSEGEWSLLPNYRLMVLGHTKNGAPGGAQETTVLLLPPDPALDKPTKLPTVF